MKFIDFNVYDDRDNLIETLPAILYSDGNNIVAQVPSGTTSVIFTQVSNGQTTPVNVTNGRAIFTPLASDTYRVGNPTISKHNEITVTGIKSLQDVKSDKMVELEQAYESCFTIFNSSALGNLKTYPINGEARDNLKDLQQRLIADPNKNNFDFLTMDDGILVTHTRAQFLQLLQDAETFEVTLHNKYRGYANQVNAATDISTVQAIKWS
jgi:hypothetical protein